MQIVTYLGFTLLSIFIQFSVIDFIQGRLKLDETSVASKTVSQKRQLKDVLKDVANKPHALYFRNNKDKEIKHISPAKFVSNITLTELLATTDMTTTVFDIFYDENTTSTDESFTTESFYTTTELENITEITFFEKINETNKIDTAPKKSLTDDCSCNILVRVCDINCCCDKDCSDLETKLFPHCEEIKTNKKVYTEEGFCLSELPFIGNGNGLFCIVKVNLPEKRNFVIKKADPEPTYHYLTWKGDEKSSVLYEFSNSQYKYGGPVWLYKNGTIYHTDLPVPIVNNYCTGRKAIEFLKNEKYKCNVKIQDLEMFQIMKSFEEVHVISATPLSINSSILNCSSLHCVNWTIIICQNLVCTNYAKSLHDPVCTESICTNIASKIEYNFYYHDFKITNATAKFHLENMTTSIQYLAQEIEVKFIVSNESIGNILKLSGNPGYLDGSPVIISYKENNYTESFFNSTMQSQRYVILPENKNGLCLLLNVSENFILFGRNRRMHCRYNHTPMNITNATGECHNIQNNLNSFLYLNDNIRVSPLGNPQKLKDVDWVSIKMSVLEGSPYGKHQFSKLLCFNLVTRYSFKFGYAQINGINRIVSANYATTARNVTFNIDDIATVITIDINFVDVTNPNIFDYVRNDPSLNIHLPDGFFYPFRSNGSHYLKLNVFTMILYFISNISYK